MTRNGEKRGGMRGWEERRDEGVKREGEERRDERREEEGREEGREEEEASVCVYSYCPKRHFDLQQIIT